MSVPTLPSMWTDVLTMWNTFLSWDIVKGFMTAAIALALAGLSLRVISRALH